MDGTTTQYERVLSLGTAYFDVSTRTANCLRVQKIKTIGEVAALSASEVLSWRNAGRKTLAELRVLLGRLGLKLAGDGFPVGMVDEGLLAELSVSSEILREQIASESDKDAGVEGISLVGAPREIQKALVTPIKTVSLTVRATHAVKAIGAQYLGELAQLNLNDLVGIRSTGRKTAKELARVLDDAGLKLGLRIDDWSRDRAQALERELHAEIVDQSRQRDRALLAKLGPEPACLEEELSRIVRALDAERNAQLLVNLWGWNGSAPRTLDSVGQDAGLTRERIRQIESRALRRLKGRRFEAPYLKAAITLLRAEVPDVDTPLASRLREERISHNNFSPWSLQNAAEHLETKWPFEVCPMGNVKVFVLKGDENTLRKAPSALRRRTSERGCVNIFALASELNIPETRVDGLKRILEAGCTVRGLDDEHEWLYAAESTRNRLANLCSKVLAVAPRVHLSELRRAVSKSRRLAMCPPQRILGRFLEQMRLGTVVGEAIHAIAGANRGPTAESAEGCMVHVLDQFGPVIDGEAFADRCIEAGMNATTFYIYRLISPVVSSLGKNVFCKVGTDVAPGVIEAIVSQRRATPLAVDHGWTPDGKLWFALELIRVTIMAGSVRVTPFVKDLVQGEWRILLPDNTEFGTATCRDIFIWSFRRAFALLGAEPGDFAAIEFDLKARTVLVRIGGPGLFEALQDPESLAAEAETEDAQT